MGRIHRPRIDPVRAERHRCNVGAAMKKLRQFSLSDEAEMRAFYASCSISESTTEAAIKLRLNPPIEQPEQPKKTSRLKPSLNVRHKRLSLEIPQKLGAHYRDKWARAFAMSPDRGPVLP